MSTSISERHLETALRVLFPGRDITVNARDQSILRGPTINIELDFWIPSLQLAFEFQDSYHYVSEWYSHHTISAKNHHDNMKAELAGKRGVSLVIVPCWWDNSLQSLTGSVHFQRPDLLEFQPPIPLNPPFNFLRTWTLPNIGELMQPLKDDELPYHLDVDNPWWLGEKYDGIRCVWNPTTTRLYSRRGATLPLPNKIRSLLTHISTFIDGEIWAGRGKFLEAQNIIGGSTWECIRLLGFDDPTPEKHLLPFEHRYSSLLFHLPPHHQFIILAYRSKCTSKLQLDKLMEFIAQNGGEGVILRKPSSVYEHGRSNSLVKVKNVPADAEALVVKVSGNLLHLQLPNKVRFTAEKTDNNYLDVPKQGDVVTFEYEKSLNSIQNVQVTRVRRDCSWEDVVHDFFADPLSPNREPTTSKLAIFTKRPYQYWSPTFTKTMRKFLERFALQRELDPFDPETWYFLSRNDLSENVAGLYGNAYASTFKHIFPDIGLDKSKLYHAKKSRWHSIFNRKKWFDDFARSRGFDPLIAANWYKTTHSQLVQQEGYHGLIKRYRSTATSTSQLGKALQHIYPTVNFDLRKFYKLNQIDWSDINNRKKTLDKFAKAHSFDPLVPANWKIRKSQLTKDREIRSLIEFCGSFLRTLKITYPKVFEDDANLPFAPRFYWASENNKKLIFDAFAREKGFDPLVAANWYKTSAEQFTTTKRREYTLKFYQNNYFLALASVYPNIGLDLSNFGEAVDKKNVPKHPLILRSYLDAFAKRKGFDPLVAENWYPIMAKDLPNRSIFHSKGEFKNLRDAVQRLYPEIGIDPTKWRKYYWANLEHQKQHFDEYARNNNFDPLVPENWYPITARMITPFAITERIRAHHKHSHRLALLAVYPKIGLQIDNFEGYQRKLPKTG